MAVLIAASCLILRSAAFELYLPNGLLPDDSLLDWAHYRTLLLGLIQERNVYAAYRAPGYERLFWWEMAVKVLSLFASFGVFFRCMMGRFWEHGHS